SSTAGAVMEDDGVLAGLEDELEVAADDRFLRPPAVDHAPFLAHERDRLMIDLARTTARVRLDARRPRRVEPGGYSSFGTSSPPDSGIRDHGATSTTVQTEREPVLARTWRRPSRRRVRSSAPAARSSSWWPDGSVSSTSSSRSSTTGPGNSASRGASATRI